jgi:signal transduction histidine kinase
MLERRSLRWPITLGVIMITLLVLLTVGWVLLSVFGALADNEFAPLYWTLLTVGAIFLIVVLVGVVFYLTLTVKAINLYRRQSNFIDSVTHELKSPLASLKLYLQTINRRPMTIEQQAEFNRVMLEDVERLDQLINHLLDAARLDRKPPESEYEEVEVAGVLRDCVHDVQVRYRVAEQHFQLELLPGRILARHVDLDLIFRNLVDNAVKYSGAEPRIEIRMRKLPRKRIEVRIADNGCGIPPAQRRKVFSRFVRLGSELERKQPGTGLGLYIVRTLVSRLRGKITVRDRGRDPGSEFVVEFPLLEETAAEAPGQEHERQRT